MITTYRKQIDLLLSQGFTHIHVPTGWKSIREIVLEAHDLDPSLLDDVVEVPEHIAQFARVNRSKHCGVLGTGIWPAKKVEETNVSSI
jgi:hypothetical protein